jgi:hypothetical protein
LVVEEEDIVTKLKPDKCCNLKWNQDSR